MRCWALIDGYEPRRARQCSRPADAATEWVYPLCWQHRAMFERIDFKKENDSMQKILIERFRKEEERAGEIERGRVDGKEE